MSQLQRSVSASAPGGKLRITYRTSDDAYLVRVQMSDLDGIPKRWKKIAWFYFEKDLELWARSYPGMVLTDTVRTLHDRVVEMNRHNTEILEAS